MPTSADRCASTELPMNIAAQHREANTGMTKRASGNTALSAADETYESLREMILDRKILPGERLFEPELSSILGVSRTPLREAVRRLQGDGLVSVTGRGAVVSKLSTDAVHELYMFRAALEAFTAELAAGRQKRGELAPSQILTLQRLRDEVERSPDAGEAARSNLRLHRFVAELSGNSFAIDALSRVWDVISISSRENISDADWRNTINRHHAEITNAIEAGDELNAASAARHHILAAAETFLRHADEGQAS